VGFAINIRKLITTTAHTCNGDLQRPRQSLFFHSNYELCFVIYDRPRSYK